MIFIRLDTPPITLPMINITGPIAAAISAIFTTICFCTSFNPINFCVSGDIYLEIKLRIIGINTSPNDIAISSISDFNIFHCPVNVLSWIAAISFALLVPVILAVISLMASPPFDKRASIPGPPRAPNISIAWAVDNPALPSTSTISAKSFVAGFTCSNAIPNSSSTPSVAAVGFISATKACLNEVPAVDPS